MTRSEILQNVDYIFKNHSTDKSELQSVLCDLVEEVQEEARARAGCSNLPQPLVSEAALAIDIYQMLSLPENHNNVSVSERDKYAALALAIRLNKLYTITVK